LNLAEFFDVDVFVIVIAHIQVIRVKSKLGRVSFVFEIDETTVVFVIIPKRRIFVIANSTTK